MRTPVKTMVLTGMAVAVGSWLFLRSEKEGGSSSAAHAAPPESPPTFEAGVRPAPAGDGRREIEVDAPAVERIAPTPSSVPPTQIHAGPVAEFLRKHSFLMTSKATDQQIADLTLLRDSLGVEASRRYDELCSAMSPIASDIMRDDQKFDVMLRRGDLKKLDRKSLDAGPPPRPGDYRLMYQMGWDGKQKGDYAIWLYIDDHPPLRAPYDEWRTLNEEIRRSIVAIGGSSIEPTERSGK